MAEKSTFAVLRFTGDPVAISKALLAFVSEHPEFGHVSTTTSGRDPQPPTPDATEAHLTTLREAGHHEAGAHLESVAALHAAAEMDRHAVIRKIIDRMPSELQIGGQTAEAYVDWLMVEHEKSSRAAGENHYYAKAYRIIREHLDTGESGAAFKTAARAQIAKAEAAVAEARVRREAQAQRQAEHDASMASAMNITAPS